MHVMISFAFRFLALEELNANVLGLSGGFFSGLVLLAPKVFRFSARNAPLGTVPYLSMIELFSLAEEDVLTSAIVCLAKSKVTGQMNLLLENHCC